MSSIRFGPITGEQDDWRQLGQLMTSQRIGKDSDKKPSDSDLREVLIICGTSDPISMWPLYLAVCVTPSRKPLLCLQALGLKLVKGSLCLVSLPSIITD